MDSKRSWHPCPRRVNPGNKNTQHAPTMTKECDYLNGWIKKMVTYSKISSKMVNTRDIAGERRRRRMVRSFFALRCKLHCRMSIGRFMSRQCRLRGKQRKRWEDNIKEWTGLEWKSILRKAENREEWRKLVVKSTVLPQRSARLRDG